MPDLNSVHQLITIVGTICAVLVPILSIVIGYLLKQVRNDTSSDVRLGAVEHKVEVLEEFIYRRGEVAALMKGVGRKRST